MNMPTKTKAHRKYDKAVLAAAREHFATAKRELKTWAELEYKLRVAGKFGPAFQRAEEKRSAAGAEYKSAEAALLNAQSAADDK